MRCSNCSHSVKPIVAIDVDGTMGDYHGHFINFAIDYFGAEYSKDGTNSYVGNIPFSRWCMILFGVSLEEYRACKLAYRQGGMKRSMPIFEGARGLCWAVRDAGAELWITTTRPYLSLDNIVPDTVEWLRRHEIEYDGMLFDEDKYGVLAEKVDDRRVVAVLDDLPDMYDAASTRLWYGHDVPILIMGHYNRAVRRPIMADLDSAADMVMARISWWRMQHDA